MATEKDWEQLTRLFSGFYENLDWRTEKGKETLLKLMQEKLFPFLEEKSARKLAEKFGIEFKSRYLRGKRGNQGAKP